MDFLLRNLFIFLWQAFEHKDLTVITSKYLFPHNHSWLCFGLLTSKHSKLWTNHHKHAGYECFLWVEVCLECLIRVHAANKSLSYIVGHLTALASISMILFLNVKANQRPLLKTAAVNLEIWPHVLYPDRFNQKIGIRTACFWPLHYVQSHHRGRRVADVMLWQV